MTCPQSWNGEKARRYVEAEFCHVDAKVHRAYVDRHRRPAGEAAVADVFLDFEMGRPQLARAMAAMLSAPPRTLEAAGRDVAVCFGLTSEAALAAAGRAASGTRDAGPGGPPGSARQLLRGDASGPLRTSAGSGAGPDAPDPRAVPRPAVLMSTGAQARAAAEQKASVSSLPPTGSGGRPARAPANEAKSAPAHRGAHGGPAAAAAPRELRQPWAAAVQPPPCAAAAAARHPGGDRESRPGLAPSSSPPSPPPSQLLPAHPAVPAPADAGSGAGAGGASLALPGREAEEAAILRLLYGTDL